MRNIPISQVTLHNAKRIEKETFTPDRSIQSSFMAETETQCITTNHKLFQTSTSSWQVTAPILQKRISPVPSAVIPDVDLVATILPKGISVKAVKSMDISQISV